MNRHFADDFVGALAPEANPERASQMSAYMKNRFAFLGIQTPARRQLCNPLIRALSGNPVTAAKALWRLDAREYQYVGCDLLRHHVRKLGASDLPQLEKLVLDKSWWDTVDGLTPVIGDIVLREPALASRMDQLIDADDFWLRRVAILHQLAWKDKTDQERLFRYCLQCAGEPEFFIRKAIGWALRQYARTAPDAVRVFLKQHKDSLSGLSLREAAKHL